MVTFARSPRCGAFALLEVILAVVIISVSFTALLRSFIISMNAIRRNDVITQGCILAEGLMQELEVDPPTSRKTNGNFEADGFPQYTYEINLTEDKPNYRNMPKGVKLDAPVMIRTVSVDIKYIKPNTNKISHVTTLDLILPPIERWKYESKFLNELFWEDTPRSTGVRRRR